MDWDMCPCSPVVRIGSDYGDVEAGSALQSGDIVWLQAAGGGFAAVDVVTMRNHTHQFRGRVRTVSWFFPTVHHLQRGSLVEFGWHHVWRVERGA